VLGQSLYPITGPLREPLLIVEWVMVFLFLELAFLQYMRLKNQAKRLEDFIEKGCILFLLAFSLVWIFYIIGDYYIESHIIRLVLYNIGYIIRMVLGLIFTFLIEKFQIFFRKFLFTQIFSIFTIISIILFFTAIEFTQYASFFLFWIPLISVFLAYSVNLLKKPRKKQNIARNNLRIYIFLFGAVILGFGFGATTDFVVNMFGLNLRLIGDLLQIVGIIILSFSFLRLPSLSEQNWKDKIDKLFLMRESGICIYYKFFKGAKAIREEQNISGAINTIKMILQELSHDKGEMVIEKEGKVLITHQGKYITGVIIADQNLNSLNFLLKRLIEKVEFLYSNIIRDWDGAMEIFLPIENITQEIFF
jgi:hypothetical protein